MGMYDIITVSKSLLPLTEEEKIDFPEGADFLTKDLDCICTNAIITDDGFLKIWRMEWEDVAKEERPYPNGKGILEFAGSLRPVNERLEYVTDEISVRFYTTWKCKRYEFEARFDSGKLIEIKRVDSHETAPMSVPKSVPITVPITKHFTTRKSEMLNDYIEELRREEIRQLLNRHAE